MRAATALAQVWHLEYSAYPFREQESDDEYQPSEAESDCRRTKLSNFLGLVLGSRDRSRGPRDWSRKSRGQSRGSRDLSRSPRDRSRGPRDRSRGHRDRSRDPRTSPKKLLNFVRLQDITVLGDWYEPDCEDEHRTLTPTEPEGEPAPCSLEGDTFEC